jgi:tRNA threonylcarbamoyl adenosine modification protein YeaZ
MIRLAVDTATAWLGVAVMHDLQVLAQRSEHRPASQTSALLPAIRGVLEEARLELRSVEEFALASGPGSFTGLRIGAATLCALADALGRRIVGVPTHLALAGGAGLKDGPAQSVLAGPRDQALAREVRFREGVPEAAGDPRPSTYLELAPEAAREGIWVCDPAARESLLALAPAAGDRLIPVTPRAEWVGRHAHLAGHGVPAREFQLDYGKSPVYRKRTRPG